MAGVLLVLEGVLPAVLSPLVAQKADEGWAPDEVGGGKSADQAVEDGEALGRSGPPRRAPVFISARPPDIYCVCVCLLLVRARAKRKGNKYGATRSAGDYRRKVQLVWRREGRLLRARAKA